jgi:hypothetical protein
MCTVTSKVVTIGSLWQPHPEVDKQKVEPGMAWYGMVQKPFAKLKLFV